MSGDQPAGPAAHGTVRNRTIARKALQHANDRAGEALTETYPATMALVGIGYALLDVADALREGTIYQRASEPPRPRRSFP